MNSYITKEDIIIFNPDFNELININLLNLYNKIIFSNYKFNDDLFDKYTNKNFSG